MVWGLKAEARNISRNSEIDQEIRDFIELNKSLYPHIANWVKTLDQFGVFTCIQYNENRLLDYFFSYPWQSTFWSGYLIIICSSSHLKKQNGVKISVEYEKKNEISKAVWVVGR